MRAAEGSPLDGGKNADFIPDWLGLETTASIARYLRAAKEAQGAPHPEAGF
jgi:hypothetical protein